MLDAKVAVVRDRGHHSSRHRVLPHPSAAGVQLFPPTKENALQAEALALAPEHADVVDVEPMQRLGETAAFGSLLLRILTLQGWKITDRPAIGGARLFIAQRPGRVVQMTGQTVADVAVPIFQACTRLQERPCDLP